jgi:BirA family biotin operon repressor/biotin-[acetyl-CoA-carboxylase] ligase
MLRWPNDVLLEGRKVAGCLIEVVAGTAGPWALVGIGINANNNPADLPNDLRTPPTSLAREAGRPIDLEELLGAVTIELVRAMTWTPETDPEFFAGASASLVQCGREVTAVVPGGGRARGVLVGLNEAGQLVLEGTDPDRRRLVAPYGTELENSGGSAIPIA